MRKHTFLIIGLLMISPLKNSYAGSAGTSPFDFLSIDADARAAALAGAFTGLADDANALLYNPAGLGHQKQNSASLMQNSYLQNIRQQYAALALESGWGVSINTLDFGKESKTTVDNPYGSGEQIGLHDLALTVGYGRSFNSDWYWGVGGKWLQEDIAGVKANGYAIDAGFLYDVPQWKGFRTGIAFQNMGPSVEFQDNKEKMPFTLRVGNAYQYLFSHRQHHGVLTLDLVQKQSANMVLQLGSEIVFSNRVPLRLGYSTKFDEGPGLTLGTGWIHKQFHLDYAFSPFGDLGSAHRISMSLHWTKMK